MSTKWFRYAAATIGLLTLWTTWSVLAAGPEKMSDVISTADLESEINAKVAEIETGLASQEAFQGGANKRRMVTTQLAIFSQALVEHDDQSKRKIMAAALREASLQVGQSASFEDARHGLEAVHAALDGKSSSKPKVDYDWSKLARTRVLMESLRDRGDQIRKAIRRSKDPATESRHAATMAVLGLAIAAHANDISDANDRMLWNDWSLEFQSEMTKTAAALRQQDAPAVLEHFTAAQKACERCHDKFKK